MSSPISEAKILGGIGSILVLLAAIPGVGWLLAIAGFAMIVLAIRSISKLVGEKRIYVNMRDAILLAVGAIAVGAVTALAAVDHVLGIGSFVGGRLVLSTSVTTGDWISLAVIGVTGLLAVWGLAIFSAVFLRRSLNSMASELNVKRFETAGLLFLIGAATAVIGVGFLVILVAEIFLAISFFSIPEVQQLAPAVSGSQVIAPTA